MLHKSDEFNDVKPKLLLFDLGGVILPLDFFRLKNRLDELTDKDKKFDFEKPPEVFFEFERGKITGLDFYNYMKDELLFSESFEEFQDVFLSILESFDLKVLNYLKELKEKLNAKNIQVGLLSNINEIHETGVIDKLKKVTNEEITSYFNKVFYSHHIQLRKPDAESYIYIKNHFNVEFEEIVFLDDTPINIDAAKKLGINALLFSRNSSLIDFFQHHSLLKRMIE